MNFHEHKLWQESYVALMDIHEALNSVEVEPHDHDVVKELLHAGERVAATIADALTRQDRRIASELVTSAVGEVAKTRTHLAVAWGRGLLEDETFKKLDDKFASLSESLQSFK